MKRLVAGVLVGGASRRMGGRAKGLLLAPSDGTSAASPRRGRHRTEAAPRRSVAERTIALLRDVADEVVLVGRADAYAALGVPAIDDAVEGQGPLAGLVALLARAEDRAAIAIACDMPFVTAAMIARLATWSPEARAVAPRDEAGWSPLFARYDAARVIDDARALLGRGAGPSALLDAVGARELPATDDERRALRDWDDPGDVEKDV